MIQRFDVKRKWNRCAECFFIDVYLTCILLMMTMACFLFLLANIFPNKGELYYVTSRTQNPVKHLRKLFTRIINVFQQLTIFEKGSILDIWLGSECTSVYIFNIFRTRYHFWSFLNNTGLTLTFHYVKSVRIRSYSGLYSVRMRENADQNNSEYGLFSRNVHISHISVRNLTDVPKVQGFFSYEKMLNIIFIIKLLL